MLWLILHGSTSLRDPSAALREGRGEALQTLETEGQMIQRVMPDLIGLGNILVLNDEAHHCYREWGDHMSKKTVPLRRWEDIRRKLWQRLILRLDAPSWPHW